MPARRVVLAAVGGALVGAVATLILLAQALRFDSPQTVIAITALLVTALTSGLGLFFTSRARTASYRDLLYQKQIALVTDMLETMALVDTFCGIILIPETEESTRANAWKELQDQLAHTNLLGARGAALLPDVVYNAFGQYHHVAVRILVEADTRAKNASTLLLEIRAHSAHLMECARALIGVEALSKETQRLVADNMLERVGKTDLQHYVALAREAERERHRSG